MLQENEIILRECATELEADMYRVGGNILAEVKVKDEKGCILGKAKVFKDKLNIAAKLYLADEFKYEKQVFEPVIQINKKKPYNLIVIVELTTKSRLLKIAEELIPLFAGLEDKFKMNEDSFTYWCHSQVSGGIGMKIRNMYRLWEPTDINTVYFRNACLLKESDEMSELILRTIYKIKTNAVQPKA